MRSCSLVVILLVLAFLWVGGKFAYDTSLVTPDDDANEIRFIIDSGESFKNIADRLEESDLIRNAFSFEMVARIVGATNDLKTGSFSIKEGHSYLDILTFLTESTSAEEVQITIPEGYTRQQIGDLVQEKFSSISADDWEAATGPESPLKTRMATVGFIPDNQSLEGYLFPDTYRFSVDATAEDIAETMILTLERRLEENDINAQSLGSAGDLSFHEAMVLASIIEREVRGSKDMRYVADIFLKRLEIGQALQADSTVNYVTGGDNPSISFKDTELDSLYNTYKYAGLPPGPISNPGINALLAVQDPIPNDWYFFLTTPEGEVIYAENFNQHVANKRLYLR